jgi:hypothetical protein
VDLGEEGGEIAAGEDGAGNLEGGTLHLVATATLGDIDRDGLVGSSDLALLLAAWGVCAN